MFFEYPEGSFIIITFHDIIILHCYVTSFLKYKLEPRFIHPNIRDFF